MTKEEIVKLAVDNDLVEEVYGALHNIIVAKLRNLRDRVSTSKTDIRLLKKYAAANKLDVIKVLLEESEVEE